MWLLLLGCVTEANFGGKTATLLCKRYAECDRGAFESTYSDVPDCVDENEPALTDYYDCLASECDFVAGKAAECLTGYRQESCSDVSEGKTPSECEDVYDGCDDADYVACAIDAAF